MHRETVALLLGEIGESDCEEITEGFLAQPANAISSGVYIIVGLWLVARAIRNNWRENLTEIVFGLTLAAVGVGSVAFHGPMPGWAKIAHDLPIAAVFALILARGVGALRSWSESTVLLAFAGATTVIGLVMMVAPDAGLVVAGVVGVVAIGVEAYDWKSGRWGVLTSRVVRWMLAILALLLVAGVAQLLGRTGAPLCDPDSVYQGHALWHVLTAIAFGLYGFVSFPDKPAEQ